jgi:hypothetical protein
MCDLFRKKQQAMIVPRKQEKGNPTTWLCGFALFNGLGASKFICATGQDGVYW